MLKKTLFLLLYFLSPLLPILTVYSVDPERYSDLANLAPLVLGCLAYTWLIMEFVISARPKWIELYFGLDRFYRFHATMALVAIVLVLFHKKLEEIVMGESLVSKIGDLAMVTFAGITGLAVCFMTSRYLAKTKLFGNLKTFLTRYPLFQYENQRRIHNLALIGLVAMYVHVMMTMAARMAVAVQLVYTLYFAIGAGFYLYHKILRRFRKDRQFIITEVVAEGPRVWTLKMKPQPGTVFNYQPGQFGFVRILGAGVSAEEHPFSISSAPGTADHVAVTVKELGDYTATVHRIQPGDTALLDGPYGCFSYRNFPGETSTVLIAGGVGITPAISMLREMSVREPQRKVLLVWGVNTATELIFQTELQQMAQTMPNFKFIPVVANDPGWTGVKGWIDRPNLESALLENQISLTDSGFYICGPANMMQLVITILKQLGVAKSRVHYENFAL